MTSLICAIKYTTFLGCGSGLDMEYLILKISKWNISKTSSATYNFFCIQKWTKNQKIFTRPIKKFLIAELQLFSKNWLKMAFFRNLQNFIFDQKVLNFPHHLQFISWIYLNLLFYYDFLKVLILLPSIAHISETNSGTPIFFFKILAQNAVFYLG